MRTAAVTVRFFGTPHRVQERQERQGRSLLYRSPRSHAVFGHKKVHRDPNKITVDFVAEKEGFELYAVQ